MMTIGKVAAAAGVGVETVRFYEREGLVRQPTKPHRGFRVYPPDVIERIRFIRQAQELGFTLRETSELLSLETDPSANCAAVREQAELKLHEVGLKVQRLEDIAAALKTLIAARPGQGSTISCSILDALNGRTPAAGACSEEIDGKC